MDDKKKKEKKEGGCHINDKEENLFLFGQDEVSKGMVKFKNFCAGQSVPIGATIINKADSQELKKERATEAKEKHIATEEEKPKEMEDRLMRLAADFENFKKRTEREHTSLRESAGAVLLLKLLPVVDEFGIAMGQTEKAEAGEFRQGMEIIYNKLLETLKKEGLEKMKVLGERFDPYLHDAARTEEGTEDNKVLEVLQNGYIFRGNVLRHAKVVVSKKKN